MKEKKNPYKGRTKRVVNCTGDADIAHLAGPPYRKTAKEKMMGVTTIFSCAGVNKEKLLPSGALWLFGAAIGC